MISPAIIKSQFAIITGAGDGLGRSFAFACAAKGYNLLLVSLPGCKLERLAAHIEHHYKIVAHFLELDLCLPESIDEIIRMVSDKHLPVSMLINNAGLGHSRAFKDLNQQYISRQLQLNIGALTQLTHAIIPALKLQAPAHIINVSSMACYYALPYKNTYAASKAYVKQLSLSLRAELKSEGISVTVVCPGGINTNTYQYLQIQKCSWLSRQTVMQPDEVAEYTLEKALQNRPVIIPGAFNRFIMKLLMLFPGPLKRYLAARSMRSLAKNGVAIAKAG